MEISQKMVNELKDLPNNTIKFTVDVEKQEVVAFTVQEKEKGL